MQRLLILATAFILVSSCQVDAKEFLTSRFQFTQKAYQSNGKHRGYQSDAISAARRATAAYLAELKVSHDLPRTASFDRGEVMEMRDEICVRHQQTFYSRLVLGTRVVLCADRSGNAKESFATISNGDDLKTFEQAVIRPTEIESLAEQALRRKLSDKFGSLLPNFPTSKSIWVEDRDGSGVLGAYLVEFQTKRDRRFLSNRETTDGKFVAIMDAVTGEMLAYEDRIIKAMGEGMVWEQNAVLTPERTDQTLGELVQHGKLRYAFFEVGTDEPDEFPVFEADGIFNYEIEDPRFDQVQVAYGLQRALGAFLFLGYQPLRSIPVITRYGDNYANAFYDGTKIALGAGDGVILNNTAWDNTIVTHEYGHMIIDDYAKIRMIRGIGEGSAVHEGYADYLACLVGGDKYGPTLGEGAMPEGKALRRCDSSLSYPEVKGKEGHLAGQALSGAMWEVRQEVGAFNMDTLAIAALPRFQPSGLFGTTMMSDAYFALRAADQALHGGTNTPALVRVFGDRGFIEVIRESDEGDEVTGPLAMALPAY